MLGFRHAFLVFYFLTYLLANMFTNDFPPSPVFRGHCTEISLQVAINISQLVWYAKKWEATSTPKAHIFNSSGVSVLLHPVALAVELDSRPGGKASGRTLCHLSTPLGYTWPSGFSQRAASGTILYLCTRQWWNCLFGQTVNLMQAL